MLIRGISRMVILCWQYVYILRIPLWLKLFFLLWDTTVIDFDKLALNFLILRPSSNTKNIIRINSVNLCQWVTIPRVVTSLLLKVFLFLFIAAIEGDELAISELIILSVEKLSLDVISKIHIIKIIYFSNFYIVIWIIIIRVRIL